MTKVDITIKKLDPNDVDLFITVVQLFEKVFEMKNFKPPDRYHLKQVLGNPGFFVFIAKFENEVVGALTAYTLDQYYSQKPLAYIYDLAVDEKYQRQGIGSQLISAINKVCRQRGFEEVFVQADKVDNYVIDFYRSTQPTEEEEVVHFYYTL
ncbi:MAG: GNAT family N-acetyltransferase [Bacteroidota bacterium]